MQQDRVGCEIGIYSGRGAGVVPADGMLPERGAHGTGAWRAAGQRMGHLVVGKYSCGSGGAFSLEKSEGGACKHYTPP